MTVKAVLNFVDVHECAYYFLVYVINMHLDSHVGVKVYSKVLDMTDGFDCGFV